MMLMQLFAGILNEISSNRDGGLGASSYFMYAAKSVTESKKEKMRFNIRILIELFTEASDFRRFLIGRGRPDQT